MTVAVAWLLAGLGSGVLVLALAVFGIVVLRTLKEPLIRTVALPPEARLPRLAVSVPVPPVGGACTVPWLVEADSKTKLLGSTSWSRTLLAALGPLLFTTMV